MRIVLLLLLLVAILSLRALSRGVQDLFSLTIRDGQIEVRRGRISPVLLQLFADLLTDAQVERGHIIAFAVEDRAHLILDGIPERAEFALRKAFDIYQRRYGDVTDWRSDE